MSSNPNAIETLKKNQDKISWRELSQNFQIFILDDNEIIKENIQKILEIILYKSKK